MTTESVDADTGPIPGTKDGRVYLLRFGDQVGRSYHDHPWPMTVGAVVTARHWDPRPVPRHGLMGMPGGLGDYAHFLHSDPFVTIVFSAAVEDVVLFAFPDGSPGAKAREARIEWAHRDGYGFMIRDALDWMVARGACARPLKPRLA